MFLKLGKLYWKSVGGWCGWTGKEGEERKCKRQRSHLGIKCKRYTLQDILIRTHVQQNKMGKQQNERESNIVDQKKGHDRSNK